MTPTPQDAPSMLQDSPRCAHDGLRWRQDGARWRQDGPRRPKIAPRRPKMAVRAQRASERSERSERSDRDEFRRVEHKRCRGGTAGQHEQRGQPEIPASQKMHKGFVGWLQGSWGLRWEECSTRVHAMFSLKRASRSMLKQVFFYWFFITFSTIVGPRRPPSWTSTWSYVGPRLGIDLGSMLGGFWEAKMAPRRPKMAPSWPQDGPRWPPR